jgi:aspartate/methionine/tyrosine aminotransferase
MSEPSGFEPPPYPYDRLDGAKAKASALEGGVVDLSIGTPCDPPIEGVLRALAGSNAERGYPPSIGTEALRAATSRWIERRFGVDVAPGNVAACIGTKEFVGTLPQYLRLRTPSRDTVLYPAVSYPTYEMGAILGGCRAVPVAVDAQWRLDLSSISEADAARALCLWVNSPSNPTGALDDPTFHALRRVVGEEYNPHRVFVASDSSANLPLMQNRPADRVLAYVCEAYACAEPTSDPERLRAQRQQSRRCSSTLRSRGSVSEPSA